MIGRTNAGGRGKLDFRVLSGLTAPANPRLNDIWIKSDIPVTRVLVAAADGWNTDRGAVNLRFDTVNYGDAKNAAFIGRMDGKLHQIWSFPTYCKISDGANLISVNAYIYRDNDWQQFSSARQYLFSANSWHDAVTGGWSASGYSQAPGSPSGGAGFDGPSIYCTGAADHYNGANGTGIMIDMRGYHTLYVDCVTDNSVNALVFAVSNKTNFQSYTLAQGSIPSSRGVIAIDISNVSGGYVVFTSAAAGNPTSRVYSMWLE